MGIPALGDGVDQAEFPGLAFGFQSGFQGCRETIAAEIRMNPELVHLHEPFVGGVDLIREGFEQLVDVLVGTLESLDHGQEFNVRRNELLLDKIQNWNNVLYKNV